MAGIKSLLRSDDGQWIIISGLIVAIGLIILSVLLNQAMISGGKASEAVLDFPKNDIREFRWEIYRWTNQNVTKMNEVAQIRNLTNQTRLLYGARGISVNFSVIEINATNQTANVTIFITDGTTTCNYRHEFIQCDEMGEG